MTIHRGCPSFSCKKSRFGVKHRGMKNVFIPILLGLALSSTTPVFAEGPSYDVIFGAEKVDFALPQILHVQITPSVTGATIQWDTDSEAFSYLEHGQTPAYGTRMPDSDTKIKAEIKHVADISGLQEFRTYHFRIKARFEGSNQEALSRPLTFTTTQTGAPKSAIIFPTPLDFYAPAVQSVTLKGSELSVSTAEESSLRFEYGPYVKGDEFFFDGKEAVAGYKKSFILNAGSLDPGVLYGYRLTSQDAFGNKGIYYGTLLPEKVVAVEKVLKPIETAASKQVPALNVQKKIGQQTPVPFNSVLITRPSQLAGIPKAELWKDEKSGRLYRVFKSLPHGAMLLTDPSQMKGLTSFQIWKDEKTGRLYKHAGIPNPESMKKEIPASSQNRKKDQRPSYIPKQWIQITHPVQLQILRAWEVWKDKKTGALYRMIESSVKKGEEKK